MRRAIQEKACRAVPGAGSRAECRAPRHRASRAQRFVQRACASRRGRRARRTDVAEVDCKGGRRRETARSLHPPRETVRGAQDWAKPAPDFAVRAPLRATRLSPAAQPPPSAPLAGRRPDLGATCGRRTSLTCRSYLPPLYWIFCGLSRCAAWGRYMSMRTWEQLVASPTARLKVGKVPALVMARASAMRPTSP